MWGVGAYKGVGLKKQILKIRVRGVPNVLRKFPARGVGLACVACPAPPRPPSPLVGSSGEIGGSPPLGDPPPKSPLEWPRGAFPPLHRWWARVGSAEPTGGLERGNRGVPAVRGPPSQISPRMAPGRVSPAAPVVGSGGLGSSPPVGLARALHPSAPSLLSAWPGSRYFHIFVFP